MDGRKEVIFEIVGDVEGATYGVSLLYPSRRIVFGVRCYQSEVWSNPGDVQQMCRYRYADVGLIDFTTRRNVREPRRIVIQNQTLSGLDWELILIWA